MQKVVVQILNESGARINFQMLLNVPRAAPAYHVQSGTVCLTFMLFFNSLCASIAAFSLQLQSNEFA